MADTEQHKCREEFHRHLPSAHRWDDDLDGGGDDGGDGDEDGDDGDEDGDDVGVGEDGDDNLPHICHRRHRRCLCNFFIRCKIFLIERENSLCFLQMFKTWCNHTLDG